MYIDTFFSQTKALQREGVVKEKWVICAVNDKEKSERYTVTEFKDQVLDEDKKH